MSIIGNRDAYLSYRQGCSHGRQVAMDGRNMDLLTYTQGQRYGTILADPPWRFANNTGKMAPEHRRLHRYRTMALEDIKALPVERCAADPAHLYLWVPNALLREGMEVLDAWGFTYKSNLVWYKIRKDGGPDGRGVGFYFRNVTELILFGVRGKNARTLAPGRRQVNIVSSRKTFHSEKPGQFYDIIESCSYAPRLELFSRKGRLGWDQWGDEYAQRWVEVSEPLSGGNGAEEEIQPLVAMNQLR